MAQPVIGEIADKEGEIQSHFSTAAHHQRFGLGIDIDVPTLSRFRSRNKFCPLTSLYSKFEQHFMFLNTTTISGVPFAKVRALLIIKTFICWDKSLFY